MNLNSLTRRLLSRALRSPRIVPIRKGHPQAKLNLMSLEERVVPAFDLTMSSLLGTIGVTRTLAAGTATYSATATGANVFWGDIVTDLAGGLNVAVTSGAAGTEAGNITDGAGPVSLANAVGTSLLFQSGSGLNLVGNISLDPIRLAAAGSAIVVTAANNVSVRTLDSSAGGPLASASLTAAGGTISGGTVVATDLFLLAGTGIGTAGTPFLTTATNLTAKTTAIGAGIFITETDSLVLKNAGGVNGISANGGAVVLATTNGALDTNGASIISGAAPITVTVGGLDNTFNNSSGLLQSINNDIGIRADRMILNNLTNGIRAGTGIVALNVATANRGIDLGTNPSIGKLGLSQGDLNAVTAGILRIGSTLASNAGIAVTSAITAAGTGWNALSLLTNSAVNGDIGQSAGATLTIPNLEVFASGTVSLTEPGNAVSQVSGIASGDLNFVNSTSLTVGDADPGIGFAGLQSAFGNTVRVTALGTGSVLTIANPIDQTIFALSGDVILSADDMAINAAIKAPGKTVTLRQGSTTTRSVTLGGGASGLGISDTELGQITTGILRIGRADNAGSLTLTANVATHVGFDTLSLISGGSIAATSGTLNVTNLAAQGLGGVDFLSHSNVAQVAGTTSNATFRFQQSPNLTVGTVDGITGIATSNGPVLVASIGAGNNLTMASAIDAGNGFIELQADDLTINAAVKAGTNTVSILGFTASRTINLGTKTAGQLGLTDAELDRIAAGELDFSNNARNTPIAVSAAISSAAYGTLYLATSNAIAQTAAGSLAVGKLALEAGAGVGTAAQPIATTAANLEAKTATGGVYVTNTGALTIGGVLGTLVGVAATTSGDISIRGGSLTLNELISTASGDVSLIAFSLLTATTIADGNGAANNVAANNLTLSAGGGIDLDTAVASITATATAAGAINLREADAVALTSITAADGPIAVTAGGDTLVTSVVSTTDSNANGIRITAATGDLTVATIAAGAGAAGDVTLQATAGSIFDDGAGTLITADVLALTSFRAIGAPGATAQIDAAVTRLTATTTGAGPFAGAPTAGIWVANNRALTVTLAATQDGVILLDSAGAMTVAAVAAGGTGNNVRLRTTAGDIDFGSAGSVTALGDTVLLQAAGAVTESGAAVKVTAGKLAATAASVGTQADPLNADVATFAATTSAGGAFLSDASSATVDSITAFSTTVNGIAASAGSVALAAPNVSSTAAGTISTLNGLTIDVTGTTGNLAGVVSGGATATLTKTGAGRLMVSAIDAYTGTTFVNDGTLLLVNGTIAGNLTVTAPGTLGGTGTISGNVGGTGTVSPGSSPGTLIIGGNFTPGGLVQFEVNPPAAVPGLGGDYDQIIVGGNVDLSGATLSFAGSNSPPAVLANRVATLIVNNGPNPITPNGSFPQGTTVNIGNNVYKLFYNGGNGNELILVENSTPTIVYVDDSFAPNPGQQIPDGDLGTAALDPAVYGINAFNTINAGLAAVAAGGTAIVNNGTYAEAVSLGGTRTLRVTGPIAATVTINSLATANGTTVAIVGPSTLIAGDATTTTIAGIITGGGNFTKVGTGTIAFTQDNTYSGTTTVSAGTLQIGAGGATGTPGTGPIVDNSNIDLNRTADLELTSGISGTGTLNQLGSGKLTLTGTGVSYTGATTVQNGILEVKNNGNLAGQGFRSNIAIGNSAFVWLTADVGLTSDLHGNISGTGSVVKKGPGIVRIGTFAGLPSLTYSGNTTVESGALELQGQAAGRGFDTPGNLVLPTGSSFNLTGLAAQSAANAARFGGLSGLGTITGTNATPFLEFGANTATFDGVIANSPGTSLSLIKSGAGTQTLTAANSYLGTTAVNGGTLLVNGDDSLATGAVAVNAAGTLGGIGTLGGAVTVNAGGTITGGTIGGVGTLAVASLAFNGGVFAADFNGNASDTLKTAGTVNLANAGQGAFSVNGQTGTTTGANVFTLIDKTGAGNIANPPLAGAPEGGPISINSVTTYASYAAGDGNNFTLTALGSPNISAAGNLVVRKDTTNGSSNIQLLQGGTVIDERPLASVPAAGNYGIAAAAASTLTVDYTAAPPAPAGPFATNINYTGFGSDSLTVTAGSFGKIAYNPGGSSSETIQEYTNAADALPITTIVATGTTTVSDTSTNTGTAIINFPNLLPGTGSSTVGTPAGATQFAGNLSPTTTFGNPAANLAVNLAAAGSLALHRLGAGFNATNGVRVNGSSGNDAIGLNGTGAIDLASLDVITGAQLGDSVTFANISKIAGTLAVTTGGTVAVTSGSTTGGNITIAAGSTIAESGGGLLATAGALTTISAGGTTLGSANAVATFNATNNGGPVLLQNQIPLNLTGVAQTGSGTVSVTNADKLTVTGGVIAGTGSIDLNVDANGIDLNAAASKVQTAGTVLLNPSAGGVTESGASQGVIAGTVALRGVGIFALDNANNDAVATFNAAVSGKLTFRDANDLTLDPLVGVATGNGDLALYARKSFTADKSGAVLVNAGGGSVRLVPGAGATIAESFNFLYDAEIVAASATFGTDTTGASTPQDNGGSNDFKVAPSKNVAIVTFGNNPTRDQLSAAIPGDAFSPFLNNLNVKDVSLVLDPYNPNTTISGTYFITMSDSSVRQLLFRQIETLGGLGFRAIVAQTGNQQYSIRLQKVVLTPQPGSITGQALQSSPFVVSPTILSTDSTYTAPTLAFGDLNGDGLVDLVIANGANDLPLVTVLDGARLFAPDPNSDPNNPMIKAIDLGHLAVGDVLGQFYAFSDANGLPTFRGGLNVAVKSNGPNARGEIVIGAGIGGAPAVEIWGAKSLVKDPVTRQISFERTANPHFVFENSLRGGVTVATGDYNGDGLEDIIVGTGPGGGPRVQVFNNGNFDLPPLDNFFAYSPDFRGGVFVAAGNFNGKDPDGKFRDDIATAPGAGGGPHIRVLSYNAFGFPAERASFFAWNPLLTNGLQMLGSNGNNGVGSISFGAPEQITKGVADPNGRQELLVGSARGTPLQLRRFTFAKDATAPLRSYANSDPKLRTPFSLYYELTTPAAVDEFNTVLNGIPILDPVTGNPLNEGQLLDGGSVAGFTPN